MIALTKEQSENLRNLGLDPKSADMYYPYLGGGDYGDTPRIGSPMEYSGGEDIPTWSQDKLLKLLPKKIGLNPVKLQRGLLTDKWFCEYEDEADEDSSSKNFSVSADNPVDACVAMIEKLHELNLL